MINSSINIIRSNLLKSIKTQSNSTYRYYVSRKRFYKNTNVLYSDGNYEITLDHRKLKTPNGKIFQVKSEPLAIAIATEWNIQKDEIRPSTMHLTALCNTALDNPNKLQKPDNVNYCINFLASDTILFHSEDEVELCKLQTKEWDPLIEWFNKRYGTNLKKTKDIILPTISPGDKMKITKYLMSYNENVIHGFVFAIDTLKSIILTFAVVDQHISVEEAVKLARLEEEYQLKFWGRVEWSHDLSQHELQSRTAASVLYIHLNRTENLVKEKLVV